MSAWTTSDGDYEDFTLAVCRGYFAVNRQYAGQTMLHLEGLCSLEDFPNYRVSYACGRDWETTDGQTVHHTRKQTKFRSMCAMGLFVRHLAKAVGQKINSFGPPTDANSVVGHKLRFAPIDIDYGPEIGTKRRIVPIEYLGPFDVTRSGFNPATVRTQFERTNGNSPDTSFAFGAAAPSSPPAIRLEELPASLADRLRTIAATTKDAAEFGRRAVEIQDVVINSRLLAAVLDEGQTGLYFQFPPF